MICQIDVVRADIPGLKGNARGRPTEGEISLAAIIGLRLATATAVSACTALKIDRSEMIRVIHNEPEFADIFLKFLLARSMRTQADLVDQLFNSSEKRLARILLVMAKFGEIRRGSINPETSLS